MPKVAIPPRVSPPKSAMVRPTDFIVFGSILVKKFGRLSVKKPIVSVIKFPQTDMALKYANALV